MPVKVRRNISNPTRSTLNSPHCQTTRGTGRAGLSPGVCALTSLARPRLVKTRNLSVLVWLCSVSRGCISACIAQSGAWFAGFASPWRIATRRRAVPGLAPSRVVRGPSCLGCDSAFSVRLERALVAEIESGLAGWLVFSVSSSIQREYRGMFWE